MVSLWLTFIAASVGYDCAVGVFRLIGRADMIASKLETWMPVQAPGRIRYPGNPCALALSSMYGRTTICFSFPGRRQTIVLGQDKEVCRLMPSRLLYK